MSLERSGRIRLVNVKSPWTSGTVPTALLQLTVDLKLATLLHDGGLFSSEL